MGEVSRLVLLIVGKYPVSAINNGEVYPISAVNKGEVSS